MSPVSVETVSQEWISHHYLRKFQLTGCLAAPARPCCVIDVIDVTGAALTVTSLGPDSGVRASMSDMQKRSGEEPSAAERQHHWGKKPTAFRWFQHFLRHFSVGPVGTTAVFAVGGDLKTGVNVAGRWLFVPNPFATLRVWTVSLLLVNVGTLFHRKMDGNGTEPCSRWDALRTTRIKTLGSTSDPNQYPESIII